MHQQVAAQAFEPLLAGFGADQEGQVGAVPGGDQLGGDRTAEKAGGPRQQDAFAGIDSGDLLTVGMHVHVFPLREVSRPRLDARVVAPQLMRGCLKEPLMALEPAKEAGHLRAVAARCCSWVRPEAFSGLRSWSAAASQCRRIVGASA